MVFLICVADISSILAFSFFSFCMSTITLFVLYKDCEPINSFLDSFIATFIFMESADNWELLVYNIYKISKAGAILLFAIAIFGTFFLVTLGALRVTTCFPFSFFFLFDAYIVAAE